jgi:peptide/nickel transport system permease protein
MNRLFLMIPVLLGVSLVIFAIMSLTPGDPATILLGEGATPDQVAALNKEFGYDKPFFQRYFDYIYGIVTRFDFGRSFRTRVPVTQEIVARAPISIRLGIWAIIVASMVGIPLGVLSAVKQYTLWDTIPSILALTLAAMPGFWVGMLLLYYLSLVAGWLPAAGIGTWRHYISPVICLALPEAAILLRYTRSSMLETIRQDYVRTVRAKGAPERDVIWGHAMKNALLPIVTIIGVDFTLMIGNAIATETLYSIPGLGRTLIEAIRMKDMPVVMGLTLVFAGICSIVVLAVDLIYAFIDPRIKANYSRR